MRYSKTKNEQCAILRQSVVAFASRVEQHTQPPLTRFEDPGDGGFENGVVEKRLVDGDSGDSAYFPSSCRLPVSGSVLI